MFAGAGVYLLHASHAASPLTGDLNGDGSVNIFDLSIFLTHWQQPNASGLPEDFNGDGKVDIFDLSILLSNYGESVSGNGQTLNCAPTSSNTMTNTVSHLCGFADTTNTGTNGTLYPASTGPGPNTGSGWSWDGYTIATTADNAVIKNVSCSSCQIIVTNPGTSIQNVNIANNGGAGSSNGAIAILGVNNVTVDHSTIHGIGQGTGSSSDWCGVGIQTLWVSGKDNPDNYTLTNNNIYWCSNPTNNFINGGLVKNNYMHDFANSSTGSHYEAMQLQSYVENGNLLTIQDNTLLNSHLDQTAAIILSNDCNSPCTPLPENNRIITHNLLGGGGYTFYGKASAGAPNSTNITFTNNDITPLFPPQWGADANWTSGGGNVWSGNIWDNTGATWSP